MSPGRSARWCGTTARGYTGSTSRRCWDLAASGWHTSGATWRAVRCCRRTTRTSRMSSVMADTKPALSRAANPAPVEGDGISYRGLFGFGAILVVTTVVCQLLMLGMLKYMDAAAAREDAERAPLSAPAGQTPPPPNLRTNEPLNLQAFREREDAILNSYGWMDKNAGIIR